MQGINNQSIDKEVPLCLSFSDVDAYIFEENEKILGLCYDKK